MTFSEKLTEILPALRMLLSEDKVKVAKISVQSDSSGADLILEEKELVTEIITELIAKIQDFKAAHHSLPQLVYLNGMGMVAVAETSYKVDCLLRGIEPESHPEQEGRAVGKTVLVTGGAQGFGGGLVKLMVQDGANVVIADLNEEKGKEYAVEMNKMCRTNKAFFVKVDVSSPLSVQNLIYEAVSEFGGFDVFISNAGVLRAGGLDEMTPEDFEFMTKVNYTGYFNCAKYAAPVLKLQTAYRDGYFADIIQINSKSGLKGSNRNFAYAGGKFGGIGLTQSFALELMPNRIKVNSICPGNFFDGPYGVILKKDSLYNI
ncbi:SDR family NAD(P)-dependent oxidoreductase [Saccharicrinis fermentans]|uniref:3-alpha-(Or 20-beta)-hydroxysteroid dehydrogenase n=1 Tax=Saccharicrinis fermentans DSM 9555 = JCM 21142 TaxID=869213 RepID=W7Y315_9BACT|nr:SDR family NAD(P)-dependent oxidoreductase [Saccharicrinis fermentans]GAF01968.1 3-alpha-(or 20-beta)-hydroxysteroid dehydrogenase [Saccharicrinis fermentans DSM 9555 = JCM 21142]